MEKRIQKTLLVTIYFSVLFMVCLPSLSGGNELDRKNKKLVVVGISAACPYVCLSPENPLKGYIKEIFELINSSNPNFSYQFRDIPSSRLIQSLRNRQVDLAILPAYATRYESDLTTSETTIGLSLSGLIALKNDSFIFTDVSDFKKESIAIADLGEETKQIKSNILGAAPESRTTTLTGHDAISRVIKLVEIKRIRFGIADYSLLKYQMRNNSSLKVQQTSITGFSNIQVASLSDSPYIKSTDLLLMKWFKLHRKDGILKKILQRYNLEDWQPLTERL